MTNLIYLDRASESAGCYRRRIAYSAQIFRVTLRLAGAILLIVQAVQAVIAVAGGGSVSVSIVLASIFAIALLLATLPPFLEKAVAKFAARMHRKSFGLYLYVFPWVLTALLSGVKLRLGPTSDQWRYVSSEGGLSEYGTAIIYLLVPLFTYKIARHFWRHKSKIMGSFYFLFTAGSFFVGMEELSWGQKIIGFEEPKYWAENNVQSEFTFHNLAFYQNNFLHQSFLLAGFLGSFCWIALRYWQKRQKRASSSIDLSYVLPDWPISSFFYPTLVYYFVFDYTDFRNRVEFLHSADEEHCEFIMALGILLFVLINFFRQAKKADSLHWQLSDRAQVPEQFARETTASPKDE